jgi:hypothetical protein
MRIARAEIEIATKSALFCGDGVAEEGTGSRKTVPFSHRRPITGFTKLEKD